MPGAGFSGPTPLTAQHDLVLFRSGNETLDNWLRARALKSEGTFGRTYVVCDDRRAIGYYALATGSLGRRATPGKLRRNSPDAIPLIILTRLAVDSRYHGRGIGRGLLKDALMRVVQASEIVGVRALLVQAIDDKARSFYEKYGFAEFPSGSRTLYLPLETLRRAL